MTIAIDGRGAYWYRGTDIGTYAEALVELLLRSEYDRVVPTPGGWKDGNFGESRAGCERQDFWELVLEPLSSIPCDCQLLHNPHNGFGIPLDAKIFLVVTIHNVIALVMPEVSGMPYREIFARFIGGIAAQADGIIAVSQCKKTT